MKGQWKDAFPPVDESFECSMECAFKAIRKEDHTVKKKVSVGFILAAVLVLFTATAFGVGKLNLFRGIRITPLEGAEELIATDLGSAENELVTLAVEEAVYDGQGVMVLARLSPKDPEHYALHNSWLMDAPEDEYITERLPAEVPEGEQEMLSIDASTKVVNDSGRQELYVNGNLTAIPESREAAETAGLPVYLENGTMYYADQWDFRVTGRKDEKEIIGFVVGIEPISEGGETVDSLTDGMGSDAKAQPDGSVLVWFDAFADALLPDEIELKLRSGVFLEGEEYPLEDVHFTLDKIEPERAVQYESEDAGVINDRIQIRDVRIVLTRVRAYLTIDYDYKPAEDEEMGIDFRLYDSEGNEVVTGSGGAWGLDEESGLYRAQMEMQSFDDMPDTLILEAKAIGGEVLGRCTCNAQED